LCVAAVDEQQSSLRGDLGCTTSIPFPARMTVKIGRNPQVYRSRMPDR
jgi:hypothetical protein